MKKIIMVTVIALLFLSCASNNAQRKHGPSFQVKVNPVNISFENARTIALQYLSHVSWSNYNGEPIDVKKLAEHIYIVNNFGNGCAWGSTATEECSAGSCTYSFSPYNNGDILCE